jgi:LacI family transcriptional regulator
MNPRITLADIAKKAGVHKTTVSMALRNHPGLPAATIARIRELADSMGYRPDPALSALVAYRHEKRKSSIEGTLAYLTNWNSEWGWKDHAAHLRFFQGTAKTANQLGFKVDHFWFGDPARSVARLNQVLVSRGIQGLLFASWLPQTNVEVALDWTQFTGIRIDYLPTTVPMHSVTNDHKGLMQLAFTKLAALGYRRIGLVMPTLWDNYVNNAWSHGYLAAQMQLSPEETVPMLRYRVAPTYGVSDHDIRVSKEELAQWIDRNQPDVILSYLTYVESAFEALGLTPGINFCYADLFVESDKGKLSGIVNRCDEVGQRAVEILVGQIHRNELGPVKFQSRTLVEGFWVDGQTLRLAKASSQKP